MRALTFGLPLLLALPVLGQDDRIVQTNGEAIEGAKVTSFDITEVRYQKGGGSQQLPADQVARLELAKFDDVFKRGVAANDPGLYLTTARERLEKKDPLMAQLGLARAAEISLANGDDESVRTAFSIYDELQKSIPNAGTLPEVYRGKFDYYAGKGDFGNALTVARRYQNDAVAGAWPHGFQVEAEFLVALAEGGSGKLDKKAFQNRLRDLLNRTASYPKTSGRINIHLADSMREAGDAAGARKIYEALVDKSGIDDNTRAGALLGLGYLEFGKGDASNKDPYKEALLNFLRAYLTTSKAYDVVHAEALYNAALSADRWQGEEYQRIRGRCKWILVNDKKYSGTRWAQLGKKL